MFWCGGDGFLVQGWRKWKFPFFHLFAPQTDVFLWDSAHIVKVMYYGVPDPLFVRDGAQKCSKKNRLTVNTPKTERLTILLLQTLSPATYTTAFQTRRNRGRIVQPSTHQAYFTKDYYWPLCLSASSNPDYYYTIFMSSSRPVRVRIGWWLFEVLRPTRVCRR